MGSVNHSLVGVVAGGVLGLCCAGCSLISERPPASDPAQRTTRAAAHCSDYTFPLADTLSTVAGVTWVIFANRKIEENEPKPEGYVDNQYGGVDYVPASSGSASDVSTYKWLRAGGYGVTGLFALSAIYGWYVEAKCHSFRQEFAEKAHPKPDAPSARPAFPGSVLGFGFEFQPAQAEQRCTAQGRSWSFEANAGLCRPPVSSAANPDVRLDFELGVPSRITVIYRTRAEQLATTYRELANSVRTIYGPPQVEAAPLSPTCAASLARCLQNGERPVGPAWRWARGTIELNPVWNDDASLELRYLRSEPAGG